MKWIEALKIYNHGKGSWCIARKGSAEYDEVKKIMLRNTPGAVAERNKERGEKAIEQLKHEASKSESRRAEVKKKYEERLAELNREKVKKAAYESGDDDGKRLTDFGYSKNHGGKLGYFNAQHVTPLSARMKPFWGIYHHSNEEPDVRGRRSLGGFLVKKFKTYDDIRKFVEKLPGWKEWNAAH